MASGTSTRLAKGGRSTERTLLRVIAWLVMVAVMPGACTSDANEKPTAPEGIAPSTSPGPRPSETDVSKIGSIHTPGWQVSDHLVGPDGIAVTVRDPGDEAASFAHEIRYYDFSDLAKYRVIASRKTGVLAAQFNIRGLSSTYALIEDSIDSPPSWTLQLVDLRTGVTREFARSDAESTGRPPIAPPVMRGEHIVWSTRTSSEEICLLKATVTNPEPTTLVCEGDLDGSTPFRPLLHSDDVVTFVAANGEGPSTGWRVRAGEPAREVEPREGTVHVAEVDGSFVSQWRYPGFQAPSPAEQDAIYVRTGKIETKLDAQASISAVCGDKVVYREGRAVRFVTVRILDEPHEVISAGSSLIPGLMTCDRGSVAVFVTPLTADERVGDSRVDVFRLP